MQKKQTMNLNECLSLFFFANGDQSLVLFLCGTQPLFFVLLSLLSNLSD